jgi:hypothetical protein
MSTVGNIVQRVSVVNFGYTHKVQVLGHALGVKNGRDKRSSKPPNVAGDTALLNASSLPVAAVLSDLRSTAMWPGLFVVGS